MRAGFGILALILALILADRATKILMMTHPETGASFSISGFLETTLHRNHGIIANIPLPIVATIGLTIAVLVVVVATAATAWSRGRTREALALALVLAGAVGNLWDRLRWGYVFDWILLFGRSAINFADIFIVVGLLWYVLGIRSASRMSSDDT